jgi:hypothetical protein
MALIAARVHLCIFLFKAAILALTGQNPQTAFEMAEPLLRGFVDWR